jgi:methyl-accepting chemotaxis protein
VSVRREASDLSDEASKLRENVVRVIRSSSEVDRRQSPRYAIDRPGRLSTTNGSAMPVQVIDISLGGALLTGASNEITGSQGTLSFSDVPFALPVRLLENHATSDPATRRVAFELSEQQIGELKQAMPTLTAGLAAIDQAA